MPLLLDEFNKTEEVELKQRHLSLQKARLEWLKKHRIYYYRPLPHQDKFHKNSCHIKIAAGSNRSGKTTAGVLDDIAFALGFRPWELPEHLKLKGIKWLLENYHLIPDSCKTPIKPPVKVIIIEDDWEVADDILLTGTIDKAGKLTFYIPPDAIVATEKNGMGYVNKFVLINGSTIKIDTEKSFTNDPLSFEGTNYDLIHWDEPKKRDMRVAMKRGLVDRHGYETFTLTPLAEPWIKDEVWDKAGVNPDIAAFFFDTECNTHISREGWEAFKASLTEDEIEARVKGKWIHLKGLVYKEFKPRMQKDGGHFLEPITHDWIRKNATIYGAIDPHARQPMTCLFLAADRFERLIVWDEVFAKVLIPDFCSLIKSKLIYHGAEDDQLTMLPVYLWIIDPIAFIEDPTDGGKWADAFHANDIPVIEAPKRKEHGIVETRQAFKDDRLFIASNCTRTTFEIQHYVYDDWKNKGSRNEKERPVDKDDHMMECLYRLILMKPRFIEPSEKTESFEVAFSR